MKKNIRIIAGKYRNTKISVPSLPKIRPTPNRVRETLFNWLTYWWKGNFSEKKVLDLFAGSGALGFEAASRGTNQVHMVELDKKAVRALCVLRDKLKDNTIRINVGNSLDALHRLDRHYYDLVLVDPPFGEKWISQLWSKIPLVMTSNGIIYFESNRSISARPGFTILRSGKAGLVHYCIMRITVMD